MFCILDRPTRLCDGVTRREMLRVGGLSTLGLSLPGLLQATERPPEGIIPDPTFGRAKSVIYVWLQGGPPQHETFDPKPEAPAEIRGAFRPVQTNVAGVHFCELLPRISRMADKLAVVRSLSTDNNLHCASGYEVLTGYKYRGANSRVISPTTDWPWFGSLVKMLKPSQSLPPLSAVWLPDIMRLNESVTPAGQTAGFLGRPWDPDHFVGDPSDPNYKVDGLNLPDVPPLRLQQRVSLLDQIERHFARLERNRSIGTYGQFQQQAFDLLMTDRVRKAFDINSEPRQIRDRYGRFQWGQCLLLARRLVEAGVRLVHVNWCREPGDSAVDNPMWDTHAQNADRLEDVLCPMFDVGFTALLEDLEQRGLLSETLVVAIGEFGRTPQINAQAGRDHWGAVFSFAMAGAGVAAGQVYGGSDKNGGYPARDRVSAGDLTATLFHLLGISPSGTFTDPEKREHRLTEGQPIRALLGTAPANFAVAQPTADIGRLPPYDDSLLLDTEFAADVPLRPVDFGSRPKGWRADPLDEPAGRAFHVKRLAGGDEGGAAATGVFLGLDLRGGGELRLTQGVRATLAQEMRNPRLGRFTLRVQAAGVASSRKFYEEVFQKHFACKLVIFRYTDADKNPTKREEFISREFAPQLADRERRSFQEFAVEKVLDSSAPGQNFPIGRGFGIAIVVEKTSDGELVLAAEPDGQFAGLHVASVRLDFTSRTINEDVTV